MYTYKAKITNVVDGDTVDADIDLGFYMTAKIRFRLSRIDTPEVRGPERPEGLKAKQFLIDLLEKHEYNCTIKTEKAGKFGRWLADIYIGDLNVNDYLVENGHAKLYGS